MKREDTMPLNDPLLSKRHVALQQAAIIGQATSKHSLGDGYTIDAVARSEGVSIATIRRWVREKRFPAPVKRAGVKGKCVWHAETLDALRAVPAT